MAIESSQSLKKPQAKVYEKRASAAVSVSDYSTAVREYRSVIEIEPEFLPAHDGYIRAVRSASRARRSRIRQAQASIETEFAIPDLETSYQRWSKEFPMSAAIEWGWGRALDPVDKDRARTHYQRALNLNPNLVDAYLAIAWIAEIRGDFAACRDMYTSAQQLMPADGVIALRLASCIKPLGDAQYRAYLRDMATRFSGTEWALWALEHLSRELNGPEKLDLLQRVHREHANDKSTAYDWIMRLLFREYLHNSPQEALTLAEQMVKERPTAVNWKRATEYSKSLVDADILLRQGKAVEAVAVTDRLIHQSDEDATPLLLLRGEANLAAYGPHAAYKKILPGVAISPTPALRAQLVRIANNAGRTPSQVDDDLYQSLVKSAKQLPGFNLPSFVAGKSGNLSAYAGQVVLVTFWAPT
jgi:tetratricopeptide (TPR) repeat protein